VKRTGECAGWQWSNALWCVRARKRKIIVVMRP
jgi:hypothetical protein